jgi:type III secretion protein S
MSDSLPFLDVTLAMLRLCVLVSMPAVLTAAAVGLLVGLLQAVTQLQDQAFPFAVKFVAVCAALALTLGWTGSAFKAFMGDLFAALHRVA